jgi:hypothetical protein
MKNHPRWWIIRPEGNVKSIGINITFLALERGFDILTVSSCGEGGVCKTLKRYSDHDLQKQTFKNKGFYFFNHHVECNSIHVNAKELQLHFTSDGPMPKNPDVPESVAYTGFSAIYWSSPELQNELVGCPYKNTTLVATQGSILAIDTTQIVSTAVEALGQTGINWLQEHQISMANISRYGTMAFKKEYEKRCVASRDPQCHVFGRGESKWWIISPKGSQQTMSPDQTTKRFILALRDLVLEDSLDILTIYTRTNGTVSKVKSISGLSPVKNHERLMCSKCQTDCKTQIGASGTISEKATKRTLDTHCTWIVDATAVGYKYVTLWSSSFQLRSTNLLSMETCADNTCVSVSDAYDVYGSESQKLTSEAFTSRSGISRISFTPKSLDKDEGFRIEWQGVCRTPYQQFRTDSGYLDDGWSFSYPEFVSCGWIIAPDQRGNVSATFTSVSLRGIHDNVKIEACNNTSCSTKSLVGTLSQAQSLTTATATATAYTFSSSTGIMLITMTTYNR